MPGKLKWLEVAAACAALVLLAGCGPRAARLDRRDEQDPIIRRAQAKARIGDVDGAIELYRKALERNPHLARAHFDLGILYDTRKKDYIRAIYHYKRYLELRPDTEKKGLIKDFIRRARISFAASLPEQPSGAVREIAELKKENRDLRQRVDELQRQLQECKRRIRTAASPASAEVAAPAAAPMAAGPPSLAAPAPAPAHPEVRLYRVRRGDTLSSIATKMYGSPAQWKKIYDANRGTLKGPESLRVGQNLVIPK